MLAARLFGKEDLRVVEIPVPSICDGEVLVRVKAGPCAGRISACTKTAPKVSTKIIR